MSGGSDGKYSSLSVKDDFAVDDVFCENNFTNKSSSDAEENQDVVGETVAASKHGRRFRTVDPKEITNVMSGGFRKSIHAENWARSAFDSWQKHCSLPTDKSIEDLSESSDLKGFVDLLVLFMLQVQKKDGEMYPPKSISSMFRAIGRIIRSRQEKRIIDSGVAEVPFNILTDVRYREAKVATEEAIRRSGCIGLGRCRKRVDVLSVANERKMLAEPHLQNTVADGCSMRFAYFCTRNFFVRGAKELRDLKDIDFSVHEDEYGEYVRFAEDVSKNYKLDIAHCAPEKRRLVKCYNSDVVETYKALIGHRPVWNDDEPPPHPLFLTPIKNPIDKNIWYSRNAVGKSTLSKWMKSMLFQTGVVGAFSNKSGRVAGINRLNYAGVPAECGMKMTGHHDVRSYMKYDRDNMGIKERAMQRIICGDENKFEDALAAEVDKYNKVQLKGKFVAEKPDVPSSSNDVFKEVRHPLADVTQRASNFNVDDDDEFWCNPLIMKAVDDAFEKYEENMKSRLLCPPTINSTHVSVGHNFSNISNCHITFNVSDANVAAGILKDLSKK